MEQMDRTLRRSKTLSRHDLDNIVRSDILVPALQTLGKIGQLDVWFQDVYLLDLMVTMSLTEVAMWHFKNEAVRELAEMKLYERYHVLVPVVAEMLVSINRHNVEPFINYLNGKLTRYYHPDVFDDLPVVWAVCEIGDTKAAEAVVSWIFEVGQKAPFADPRGLLWQYQAKLLAPTDHIREIIPRAVLTKLLGDFTDLILNVLAWKIAVFSVESKETYLNTRRCEEAIKKLCEIDTPISSNILHKISRIDRLLIGTEMFFDPNRTLEYFDFKEYSKMAKDELKHRGNPRHDSSTFLNQDAWNDFFGKKEAQIAQRTSVAAVQKGEAHPSVGQDEIREVHIYIQGGGSGDLGLDILKNLRPACLAQSSRPKIIMHDVGGNWPADIAFYSYANLRSHHSIELTDTNCLVENASAYGRQCYVVYLI